jgi:hypothetical protein
MAVMKPSDHFECTNSRNPFQATREWKWQSVGGIPCPGDNRGAELTEEEMKVQEFIAKRGVTKCPGYGSPELAKWNIKREMQGFHEASEFSTRG